MRDSSDTQPNIVRVMLVGSNPSCSAETLEPFCHTTRSGKTLRTWLEMLSLPSNFCFHFCNLRDLPSPSNRCLSAREIRESIPSLLSKIESVRPHKLVALGRTSERALKMLDVSFFSMPHPSGLNRKLNDKLLIAGKIHELRQFILA